MPRRAIALILPLAIAAVAWMLSAPLSESTDDELSEVCRDPQGVRQSRTPVTASWATDPAGFIAHGGGGIDGTTNTDSVESVAMSISRGYRMIELDIQVSSDGFLVAAHDWKSFRQRTGSTPATATEQAMSLAEFQSKKIDGKYTPLDENGIRSIFLKHRDLILVTDKIRDFPRLVKAFPFQERVIVEVFSQQEFASAKASGVVNPMLSIGDLEAYLDLILNHPTRHVALSVEELTRCPGAARKIIDSGRRVFVFTTNDEDFMARYAGTHVSAFYTDFWHIGLSRCEGSACPDRNRQPDNGR